MRSSANDVVLVLGAGRGRRMGGPKAMMTVAGRPWWREQERRIAVAALAGADVASWWVASEQVVGQWRHEGDRPRRVVVADFDAPMFASIIVGMQAIARGKESPRGVFVLPVDVPASEDATVWSGLRMTGAVARPTHQGRHGHPLYLPWVWAKAYVLPRSAEAATLRLDQLIGAAARDVAVQDPSVIWNLNTPEDVQRFERVCCDP